jgi:hypothetical protein
MESPPRIYQLRIGLSGVTPPAGLRLFVASTITLGRLDEAIQTVMGWEPTEGYRFLQYGHEVDGYQRLDYMLNRPGDVLAYEPDAGNSWKHNIVLEEIVTPESVAPDLH